MELNLFGFQRRPQFLQRRFDTRCDVPRVRAVLLTDHQHDSGLPVDERSPDRRLGCVNDGRDISEYDGRTSFVKQNRAGKLLGRQRLALRLQYDALIGRVDEAGAAYPGRFARRGQNIVHADVKPDQIVGTDLHLQRPDISAVGGNLRDAGYGQQPPSHCPVRNRAQIHQRALIGRQSNDQNRTGHRREWRHRRRLHALRQAVGEDGKALRNQLARPVDVATRSEYDGHDRQPLNGGRSHAFDARQAVDRRFDRLGDENLDLLGAEAWRFGLDRDLWRRKFGEHVVLGIPQCKHAIACERTSERKHDPAEANGEGDQRGLGPRRSRANAVNHCRRRPEARSSPPRTREPVRPESRSRIPAGCPARRSHRRRQAGQC